MVIRSPTLSTVPTASPTSTTSPTPYWSSNSMNIPVMKSRTKFCAPKPSATPTMPADAMKGATFTPRIASDCRITQTSTKNETADLRTDPRVCARCARRFRLRASRAGSCARPRSVRVLAGSRAVSSRRSLSPDHVRDAGTPTTAVGDVLQIPAASRLAPGGRSPDATRTEPRAPKRRRWRCRPACGSANPDRTLTVESQGLTSPRGYPFTPITRVGKYRSTHSRDTKNVCPVRNSSRSA